MEDNKLIAMLVTIVVILVLGISFFIKWIEKI